MPTTRRRLRRTIVARLIAATVLAALLALAGAVVSAAPARAASQGSGFGTWAPVSPFGWHGSMIIGGVHTYCILPGAPAPTGDSIDQGVSGSAAGLSPQQLTGINLLVTRYGQTDDPVQAAAVGWAVKAISNWHETLHHFGYPGSSLAGAIDWTFSSLAPEHNAQVQRLAVVYYDEATATPAGAANASGTLTVTTDAADPRRGSVRVDATTTAATGTLTLVNAVFTDTGTPARADAVPGVDYAISASAPDRGRPFTVTGSGRFRVDVVAAVRHFTTAGGQDTAGPAGELSFEVAGADATSRVPSFSPEISTQVAARYPSDGGFVDDVRFGGAIEDWPRSAQGDHLPVTATAEVYRTDSEPRLSDGIVPADAVPVGSLAVTTNAPSGPADVYRVTALWNLPGPGFYTAVWRIDRDAQTAEVVTALPADFAWVEAFGESTQVLMVPAVSSRATPTAAPGDELTDVIIVGDPIPAAGLVVSSALYLAPEDGDRVEACTAANLLWSSDPVPVTAAGEYAVTAPAVTRPGVYVWQERAVDDAGELVHLGECGAANETTIVSPPAHGESTVSTDTPALAATGPHARATRTTAGIAVGLVTSGGIILALSRGRRFVSRSAIG